MTLRELAADHRRFGYLRLGYHLAPEGMFLNHTKLPRVFSVEGLQTRRRSSRKRALGARAPITIPEWANQRWSPDKVYDSCIHGWRCQILCVVDDFSRKCLALVVGTSISDARVARKLAPPSASAA